MGRQKQETGEPIRKSERRPAGTPAAAVTLRSGHLTTCRVAEDGTDVRLEFIDQSGQTVVVELPLDQAEIVVMTLPHMLSNAVRRKTGNSDARYVFDLGEWVIESAKERSCLIATLKTPNGFEVSFAIPPEAGRSLGWTLQQESSQALELAVAAGRTKVN